MALQGFPQFLTNFNDISSFMRWMNKDLKTKKHFIEYPTNYPGKNT